MKNNLGNIFEKASTHMLCYDTNDRWRSLYI